jgi:hypothetical protein
MELIFSSTTLLLIYVVYLYKLLNNMNEFGILPNCHVPPPWTVTKIFVATKFARLFHSQLDCLVQNG